MRHDGLARGVYQLPARAGNGGTLFCVVAHDGRMIAQAGIPAGREPYALPALESLLDAADPQPLRFLPRLADTGLTDNTGAARIAS